MTDVNTGHHFFFDRLIIIFKYARLRFSIISRILVTKSHFAGKRFRVQCVGAIITVLFELVQ